MMTKKTRNTKAVFTLLSGVLLVACGCGDSSPTAPVDNIEKNIKTKQDMKSELGDINKKKKEDTDAALGTKKK